MADKVVTTHEGIAAALAETKFPTEEAAAEDGWDSFDEAEPSADEAEEAPDATPGEPPSKDTTPEPGAAAEDESPAEVPEVYWGTDLTGIPAEKRAEIIAHLEQQDSTIQKLQGRISALSQPDESAPPETPVEPEEVSDEVLLRAAGLDPEAFETQQAAPMLLPVLRRTLALEDKVDAVVSKSQENETLTAWNSALDELETSYGKLGFARADVLKYAVAEKVASPYEAYFKLSAPIKREVEQAAAIARREALKKEASGGVKPRSNAAGEPLIKKGTSLRDAVMLAAKAAEKETKLSWRDAVKRRLVEKPSG